ncbi:DUF3344 domain-containing protein [Streptomyces sp. SP18CS02]|uniref:DUF3344 domain-containing protein n=1 Tax=Streptomyces sp. SP18CS02 TaxID=3002531 RepID=UPI002E788511|nr:DUF3344 domain-containing protein [Streptomyces sp. SP18CS02]MEE1751112.1 DUF3344 domain-containing protein [Streptomyces sp. SP18CS02]
MRDSVVLAVRRGLLCLLSCVSLPVAHPAAATAPGKEADRIAFAQRFYALQRGGLVRAANAAVSCRVSTTSPSAALACGSVRNGGTAANDDRDMFYVDVDDDPNTYNSGRGEVLLPKGAVVTYARLYWGGNLRVGEQKPPEDNGRVLIAEPGGEYKEVLADSTVGHRTTDGADAFQASADVTRLVRGAGPGMYTVAQVNVARGESAAGSWGGWTLVVAYEHKAEPLRHLSLWDGFETLDAKRKALRVDFGRLAVPADAPGRLGMVAYDGDRGTAGDSLALETRAGRTPLSDSANAADDVMNSSVTDFGTDRTGRFPEYRNTLGYDSDVLNLRTAFRGGADRVGVRIATGADTVWLGALFLEADARG